MAGLGLFWAGFGRDGGIGPKFVRDFGMRKKSGSGFPPKIVRDYGIGPKSVRDFGIWKSSGIGILKNSMSGYGIRTISLAGCGMFSLPPYFPFSLLQFPCSNHLTAAMRVRIAIAHFLLFTLLRVEVRELILVYGTLCPG